MGDHPRNHEHNQERAELRRKQAFRDYVNLGPGRDLDKLTDYYAIIGVKMSKQTLGRYMVKDHWAEQIKDIIKGEPAAHPLVEEVLTAEAEKAIARIEDWDKVQREHREQMVDISMKLLNRAREMLELPIVKDEIQEDGQTVVRLPVRWSAADVARYIEVADKAVRLAAEMDTSRDKVTVIDEHRAAEIAKKYGLDVDSVVRRAEEIASGKS